MCELTQSWFENDQRVDMGTLVTAMEVPAINLEKICMANFWCRL